MNKDGNERSTASKAFFGTWLTNGLVLSVGGVIFFIWGLSMNNSLENQLRVALGGTNYAPILIGVGIILLLIGVGCIGVHLSKKKK